MRKIKIPLYIDEFELDELPADILALRDAAIEAREKAYAPYSHFRVGAALLLDNGKIITGSNQENAAFPSGMCAERVAIWYAGAQYPGNKILKMFITARSEHKPINQPIPPCGACRQSMAEYEIKQKSPIEIYFSGETGKIWRTPSVANILPLLFDGKNLD